MATRQLPRQTSSQNSSQRPGLKRKGTVPKAYGRQASNRSQQPAKKGFKALDWVRNRPTGPTIWFEYGRQKNIYCLQIERMEVKTECYISQAMVRVTCQWQNMNDRAIDCLFAMPLSGVVTQVEIDVGDTRKLETLVVSNDDLSLIQQKREKQKRDEARKSGKTYTPSENPVEQYIPNLFRLPISNVGAMEKLTLTVEYIEPLQFVDNAYKLDLPLVFAPGTLKDGVRYEEAVTISTNIKSFAYLKDPQIQSSSHTINVHQDTDGDYNVQARGAKQVDDPVKMRAMGIQNDNSLLSQGRNFELTYSVDVSQTMASTVVKMDEKNRGGTMVTFITPPSRPSKARAPARAVYFLLDRSGSMIGEPFNEAKRALEEAIDMLNPHDTFNVCAFDHRQLFYSASQMVPADQQNKSGAKQWFSTLQTERGGTDISTPLLRAVDTIQTAKEGVLPFIVLITDGCVHNERDICKMIETRLEAPGAELRFFNLGIGSYCNWYFLKMLSLIGRGYSDVVIYKEKIYEKTRRLLDLMTTPVLGNLELQIDGPKSPESFPSPIPDLYQNEPLVVGTKFKGQVQAVSVVGEAQDKSDDVAIASDITPASGVIPIDKVFAKQQLDAMTAQHWFNQKDRIRQDLVKLSCEQSIPTAHTSMICYETDQKTSAAAKQKNRGKKKFTPGKIALTAAAVGTVFVVGAAVFSFGDIGNTAANVPLDGLDVGGGGGGDLDFGGGGGGGGGDFGGGGGGEAGEGGVGCDDCDCEMDCGDCTAM